ncbi:O-antigen ligase family protein [Rhodopirellula sp. MGV]|uniref:O-antigen ligase family protein n=1 Tax=Rhodopirellula sp. MGV TaxID=2023130 RepID=UPI0013044C02|nr:O-antigen ligase family protein [Rhodopirellula sp. MGV]
MVHMLLGLLWVGTIFGPPFFAFDGPIQISLDRLLLAITIGVAAFHWWTGAITLPSLNRVDVCVAALVVYIYWSSRGYNIAETIVDPTARWLFYILVPAIVYGLARITPFSSADFKLLMRGIIVLGLYLSVTAVCEVKGFHSLVYPKHTLDPKVWMFLGRGRGPLLNPAGNGLIIAIAMASVSALFVKADRQARAVYAALGVILFLGCYATLTRSCWLGIVGAVVAVGFVFSPRWMRVMGIASVALLAVAMSMGLKEQIMSFKRDKALSAEDAAKSVELRPLLAAVAWEMFKDKPLTGHGYGQYLQRHTSYHSIRELGLPLEMARPYSHHNAFLAFLVDSGLIGLGLYLAILGMTAVYGWQLAHNGGLPLEARQLGLFSLATLAAYLPNAMFHNMTIIPMVQIFLLTTSGLVITVYQRGLSGAKQGERRRVEHQQTRSSFPVTG